MSLRPPVSRPRRSSGPCSRSFAWKPVEEAIAAANGVKYGLTGSVFTRDISHAFKVINELEAGITHVNNPTIGGGPHALQSTRATGVGPREMGPDAWKFYAESKTIHINGALAARKNNHLDRWGTTRLRGRSGFVCLTEEPTEILYALGEQERIVGISAYTERPPEAKRDKPVVSAFIDGSSRRFRRSSLTS